MPKVLAADPAHVPEVLTMGPTSAYVAGPLLVLVFTHPRPDVAQIFGGNSQPDVENVVVSRLTMPLENAGQLARVIINALTSAGQQAAPPT